MTNEESRRIIADYQLIHGQAQPAVHMQYLRAKLQLGLASSGQRAFLAAAQKPLERSDD
jgi:hypothetical protein